MSWTAPRTWADDEVPTAALLNTHISDNIAYLKGLADAFYVVTSSAPTRVLGTEYQNSTKTRIITVYAKGTTTDVNATITFTIKIKSTSPADTVGIAWGSQNAASEECYCQCTFVVPPNYYYSVTEAHVNTGALTDQVWTEWELY